MLKLIRTTIVIADAGTTNVGLLGSIAGKLRWIIVDKPALTGATTLGVELYDEGGANAATGLVMFTKQAIANGAGRYWYRPADSSAPTYGANEFIHVVSGMQGNARYTNANIGYPAGDAAISGGSPYWGWKPTASGAQTGAKTIIIVSAFDV